MGAPITNTVYVRDASGNVMSVYEYVESVWETTTLKQKEVHVYGSSRLGMDNKEVDVESVPGTVTMATGFGTGRSSIFTRGEKVFELSNHLGNVLVTVSDRHLQVSNGSGGVSYYEADIVTASDYSSSGMLMNGRKYSAKDNYRYRYNGKEHEDNIGSGIYDLGLRIYDSRIGRFFSTDPRENEYAWQSTYAYYSNNFIAKVDFNGGGEEHTVKKGETLSGIAASRGTTVKMLQEINKIKNADHIQVGQQLILPTLTELQSKQMSAVLMDMPGMSALNIKGVHFVFQDFTPEIYSLTSDAQKAKPQWIMLTYNGGGAAKEKNRREATRQLPGPVPDLKSRDEYPYATTTQGGAGAMVRYVPVGEQKFQAIDLQFLYNGYGTGNKMKAGDNFLVVTIPRLKPAVPSVETSREIKPIPTPPVVYVPVYTPKNSPGLRPAPVRGGPGGGHVTLIWLMSILGSHMYDGYKESAEKSIKRGDFEAWANATMMSN